MEWTIRSLAETSTRARGAFRQYMKGTDSSLLNNLITITAKVLAVMGHEFELRMAYLAKQIFISTATGQFLVRRCADIGIYQKGASTASGVVLGAGAPSTTYPQGLRFISGSVTYLSTVAVTSAVDGNLSVPIRSEVRGSSSNREANGLLAFADPVLQPDLGAEWTVGPGGLGGGADAEDLESLRSRGLQRQQNPPGAGGLADYERIVRAVPGVIKAWAFRVPGAPGAIVVHFLFAGRVNSIPEASDVAVVQAALDLQRLIRVDDSVATAPVARPVNIVISGLSGDTAEIRAAIKTAISAMFVARCRPGIVGNTFTLSLSWINEAISGVTGEDRHILTAPAADIVLTGGQFPVLGTVTYVA